MSSMDERKELEDRAQPFLGIEEQEWVRKTELENEMRQLILDINARKTLEERPTPNKIDKALRRLWGWLYDRRTAVDFLGFALLFDMMPHGKRLLENTAYALGIPIWGQLLLELVLYCSEYKFWTENNSGNRLRLSRYLPQWQHSTTLN